jgi:hypothetical protein
MTGVEIAIIALAVGGGIQAYGQYQQGKQSAANIKAQAEAQSAWNLYNAKVAKREADAEQQAAAFESKQAKRRAEALLSKQRALIGVTGVTPEGSPLLVMEDTAAELATEVVNIRLTGERRVSALKSQSILDISKAQTGLSIGKVTAAGVRRAGTMRAGATLLQTGGKAGMAAHETGSFGF